MSWKKASNRLGLTIWHVIDKVNIQSIQNVPTNQCWKDSLVENEKKCKQQIYKSRNLANKILKRYSTTPVISEVTIKTSISFDF